MKDLLLIGLGLYTFYQLRNGWPSLSAIGTTPIVANVPASQLPTAITPTTPAQQTPITTNAGMTPVIITSGGGGPLVDPNDISRSLADNNANAITNITNGFINWLDSISIGDPGGAHPSSSPYAPGVVDAGPTVDASTLTWINDNYGDIQQVQ